MLLQIVSHSPQFSQQEHKAYASILFHLCSAWSRSNRTHGTCSVSNVDLPFVFSLLRCILRTVGESEFQSICVLGQYFVKTLEGLTTVEHWSEDHVWQLRACALALLGVGSKKTSTPAPSRSSSSSSVAPSPDVPIFTSLLEAASASASLFSSVPSVNPCDVSVLGQSVTPTHILDSESSLIPGFFFYPVPSHARHD